MFKSDPDNHRTFQFNIGGQDFTVDYEANKQTTNGTTAEIIKARGYHLVNASPKISQVIEQIGTILNIARHPICNDSEQYFINGPIEVWQGYGPGNEAYAYLLDTHRLFPPAACNMGNSGGNQKRYLGYFYFNKNEAGSSKLFRPEAVSLAKSPLHSDSFKSWNESLQSKIEKEKGNSKMWHEMHNKRTEKLLEKLEKFIIPKFRTTCCAFLSNK